MNHPFGGISYTNANNGPFWGFSYNKNQYFKFRHYDSSDNGLTEIEDGVTIWTRTPYNSGESLTSNHNFYTSLFLGSLSVSPLYEYRDSTLENGLDTLIAIEHTLKNLPKPENGKLGKLSFKYNFTSRRNHKFNNFFPQQGYGIQVRLDISHEKIMSDFNFSQLSFDVFNNYKLGEYVLYSRFMSIAQFGNPPAQDKVNFSTDESNYIPTTGISEVLPENYNLRGSSQFRFGDRMLFGTIELRNKIMENNLPINIFGITAGNFTSALISDFGNIWNNSENTGDFISTAGFEIKFSIKSGGFPMMNFAYGYANEIKNIHKNEGLYHYYRLVLINPF